ncbi:MAG: coniferyl aldehyde dehydrogenase [Hyphomonadaceae bacterium]|nr:coniferyl aldehyde dehydrogenase [Hyphomonadaceae bacterium]
MSILMADPKADETKARMHALLAAQKAAHLREGAPSAAKRKDRLNRCISILQTHATEIVDALNADFGNRSKEMSMLTDVAGAIGPLKHARDNLDKWMRSEKRKVEAPLNVFGAKAEVRFQPKGVVGVISPWNFPVQLTFGPLAGILAAGNRAMIKPSEYTPETSALMARLFDLVFDEEEISVIVGGPEVGAAFAGLAFDHLIFTGGTSIAYHVMRAAADNLVPLTLELGGKSPVIVSRSADIKKAAARVMTGKTMNAGQICLAPDYTFVPRESRDSFVQAASDIVAKMYPTIKDNPDYTAIINQRHYDRIKGLVEDARAKGAQVVEINPNNEDFTQQEHRRIPPTLILDPTDDMKVMQEEIFGPVMPIKTYADVSEAVAYVNANPRPLGLYVFSEDAAETERVLETTTSGGVTVNDVIFHVSVEDLPFGGVGPAGMGSYHGKDGFLEFSHKKAVYTQIKADLLSMMRPPYGDAFRKQVAARVKG